MKVVMVEPNKPAYVTEIGSDLESMQKTVGGLIESVYYLDDPYIAMVRNKEAGLLGMEENRRFGDKIIAGTFFICGDDGEDFCSLPDALCEKYAREFSQPQEILREEVQENSRITFTGF